jgi:hypothetical protein
MAVRAVAGSITGSHPHTAIKQSAGETGETGANNLFFSFLFFLLFFLGAIAA